MKRAHTLLPIGLSLGALVLAGCGSDDSVSLENSWARASAAGQTTGVIYFDLTVDEDDTLQGASVDESVARDAQVHEVVMADMESGDMDSSEIGDMDESGDMEGFDDMADMDCEELRSEHMENSEEHMDTMDSDEMDEMDDVAEMSCDELLAEHSEHMDDGEMGDMDMGAIVMQQLTDGLELTAGETVTFEPGSYHVMLLDLVEPLEVGDEVEVTLEFAEADPYTTTVEVAESAP
jgi:copper(I)-binding protein